LDHQLIEQLAH